LFNANAEEANKDGIVSDATNLGAMAQQYYKKPLSMGGGGNAFTNWNIPLGLDSTANGTYSRVNQAQSVVITGTPFPSTNYLWTVTTTVNGSSITTTIQ